jgi:hypothetical protein
MTTEKKKNHYVPQFYLRNFSLDKKSIGMYHLPSRKHIQTASIANVACRDYLYGKTKEIEDWFTKQENRWSTIVRKIITEVEISLSDKDYMLFLLFVFLSDTRAAQFEDEDKVVTDAIVKSAAYLYKQNRGTEITQSKIEELIAPNTPAVAYTFSSAAKAVSLLKTFRPLLIVNQTGRQFITSDCPVVKYNQFLASKNYTEPYGYGHAGFQCFLPLNKMVCFALIDETKYRYRQENNGIIEVSAPDVIIEFNRLFARNAYHHIFFENTERDWVIERYATGWKKAFEDNVRILPQNGGFHIVAKGKSILTKYKIDIFESR